MRKGLGFAVTGIVLAIVVLVNATTSINSGQADARCMSAESNVLSTMTALTMDDTLSQDAGNTSDEQADVKELDTDTQAQASTRSAPRRSGRPAEPGHLRPGSAGG